MSNTIFFSFPGNEELTEQLGKNLKIPIGNVEFRKFPDGESHVRILTEVKQKQVLLVCTLHQPDDKLISLYFFFKTAKSLGAKKLFLVAPYLGYMRQDTIFNPGEGVTSRYFGELLSSFIDGLVTIDPHLHRIKSLSMVYAVPCIIIHAAEEISNWILQNISDPVLIGPDEESRNWVSQVAQKANAPFIILNKTRFGDRKVKVTLPDMKQYINKIPVLVDDIISTARTMIEVVEHLKNCNIKDVTVIGIHAIFANDAYQNLLHSGVKSVVTCNTIPHTTNIIDISYPLGNGIKNLLHRIN